jgi:hypothetical protein
MNAAEYLHAKVAQQFQEEMMINLLKEDVEVELIARITELNLTQIIKQKAELESKD